MSSITICLVVFVVMLILFFTNKIPMSFTALAAMMALVLTGCLDGSTAIATFGSSTVVTMAAMFVVAAGLSRTQMINHITKLLYKVTDGSFTKVLACYVLVTCLLGQFVPSIVALFALVHPLVQSMCDRMNISPSKMMFPIAVASVSTSFIIEPIGPYAAWYVTQNGYMESYGWTSTQLNMWSETCVLLPVGILTLLWAIFVMPRMLPDHPERPITAIGGRKLQEKEPLSPVREVLGYGIFVVVIICLMLGFSSWQVTLVGAIIVVATGVLTEREAIDSMNLSTVLLYAGVSAFGSALAETGAADMIGNGIAQAMSGITNGYVIGFVFYVVGFLMTSLLYNRAVSTVLVPVAVITCGSIGCDPRGPVILCALATMSSLITPMSTAVVPMAMNAGGYSAKTVFKVAILPGLLRGIVGTLIAMTLFPV